MHEALPSALARARSRLNAVISLHRALAWSAPTAIAAGLATAALRMAGVRAAGFFLWSLAVAAGAAAGYAAARRSRVDAAGTARWLDERLGDGELLSAALVCVGRGSSEPFDAEIVERAEALIPAASALRPTAGPLAKRAAIAAAACAVGAYLVFLAAPLSIGGDSRRAAAAAAAGDAETAIAAALSDADGATAEAFASSLFPDDKRLATLAERALREGRIDDLADMLKTADLEYESRISRAVGEPERKKLADERQRIQEAASAIAMRNLEGGAGEGHSRGEGGAADGAGQRGDPFFGDPRSGDRGLAGSGGTPSGKGSGGGSYAGLATRPGDRGATAGPGPGGDPGAAESEAGKGGSGSSGGGLGGGGPGFGAGSGEEGDWGRIEPLASGKKVVIEPSKEAPFFELVLPGQAASSPIAGLIPDSRRSAESAMARESVPLEYEDFVRSYFLSLSKGESR